MRLSTIFFLVTLAVFFSFSCEKKENIIQLHFNETGCANPWNNDSGTLIGFGNNDPDYENKVKNYLIKSGLVIKDISITNDGPISGCFSCFCTTGRKINISVFEKDRNLAEGLGFGLD
jgi:hypothetical protein